MSRPDHRPLWALVNSVSSRTGAVSARSVPVKGPFRGPLFSVNGPFRLSVSLQTASTALNGSANGLSSALSNGPSRAFQTALSGKRSLCMGPFPDGSPFQPVASCDYGCAVSDRHPFSVSKGLFGSESVNRHGSAGTARKPKAVTVAETEAVTGTASVNRPETAFRFPLFRPLTASVNRFGSGNGKRGTVKRPSNGQRGAFQTALFVWAKGPFALPLAFAFQTPSKGPLAFVRGLAFQTAGTALSNGQGGGQ